MKANQTYLHNKKPAKEQAGKNSKIYQLKKGEIC
jgi:hypothetical protein